MISKNVLQIYFKKSKSIFTKLIKYVKSVLLILKAIYVIILRHLLFFNKKTPIFIIQSFNLTKQGKFSMLAASIHEIPVLYLFAFINRDSLRTIGSAEPLLRIHG